jgi:hypothetical protein
MIPALKREREALANRPDLMQLNKGEAPTRFILARLDIIIEQHFPEKSRAARVKPGPLVAALINAALELNSNTTLTLTPRRLADHRQYLRTKRG